MNRQIEKYVKSTNEGGGSMLGSVIVQYSTVLYCSMFVGSASAVVVNDSCVHVHCAFLACF